MPNRFNLPHLGFGLGLRDPHYEHILETRPALGWFEIISENFIDIHAGFIELLDDLRSTYPIVMHGVSLSIGSTDPLNLPYLQKVKNLARRIESPWVSDHLCWTGVQTVNSHDLLPVPYTEEALRHIVARVRQVQDVLERPLLLENPSSYAEFSDSSMSECEFIARLAEEADCALLLDVNNVYVSSVNHRFDPYAYIDAVPADRVVQIHLAGHYNKGTHIVDTHDNYVIDPVWELYAHTIRRLGHVSTMVEWDENIPDFPVLFAEIEKARHWAAQALETSPQPAVA